LKQRVDEGRFWRATLEIYYRSPHAFDGVAENFGDTILKQLKGPNANRLQAVH